MKNVMVVKVGSTSLINNQGKINVVFLRRLVSVVQGLQKRKKLPLLVVSGAVAAGKSNVPSLVSYQARASRGQLIIASCIHQLGEKLKIKFSLLLLSKQDILDRNRYETLKNTFNECLEMDIVPIINENDATSATDTHDFVDNDQVATIVGMITEAQEVFLLTNVAGVFKSDPKKQKENGETPIAQISDINDELMRLHIGKKSLAGRGGMESKLKAARLASFVGMTTYILNRKKIQHILEIIDGKPCQGTVCLPWNQPIVLTDRSRWLITSQTSSASIKIDTGAVEALRKRKSLLAVGVKQIFGSFNAFDSVEVIDEKNRPIALGISDLSSANLNKIIASSKKPFNIEVMHANHLILFPTWSQTFNATNLLITSSGFS